MNKLFTTAETAALDLATAGPASTIISTTEAKGSWLQRWFNCPWLRRIAGLKTNPTASADSQLVDEQGRKSITRQSVFCDLAASNPHFIATSVFSRKIR
jgi:hypothetical protein